MPSIPAPPLDPLEDVLPDVDAVHHRLHIVSRECSLLRRLLRLAVRGRDELDYRRSGGQEGQPCES